jgi:hypothetical protein
MWKHLEVSGHVCLWKHLEVSRYGCLWNYIEVSGYGCLWKHLEVSGYRRLLLGYDCCLLITGSIHTTVEATGLHI